MATARPAAVTSRSGTPYSPSRIGPPVARRDRIVLGAVEEIRARVRPDEVWIFTSGARYMDWSAPILAVVAPSYGRSVAPIEPQRFTDDAGPDLPVPAGGRTVLLLHEDLGAAPPDRWRPAFRIDRETVRAAEAEEGEVVRIRRHGVEIAPAGYDR